MEILIHIDKRKLDSDYEKATAEYIKRLSAFCRTKILCYKDFSKLSLQASSACFRIAPGVSSFSSEGLAQKIEQLALSGYSRLEFVIGTSSLPIPELSLSGFSMSTDLTTVVLTEQLYRAYTILNHITYHK